MALAFIGPPRSACRVSWPGGTLCLVDRVVEQRLEQVAVSVSATHQPTTRRLKMSIMT